MTTPGGEPRALYTDETYLAHTGGTWHADDSPFKARQVLEILARNKISPARLGEVGCGAGEVLRLVAAAFPAASYVQGYDIAGAAIALAQSQPSDRIGFHHGDFMATRDRYDVLMALDVIEHLEDYFTFLRALRTRTDYLVLHIPLELCAHFAAMGEPLQWVRRSVGHLHHFNKDMALAVLAETGYDVIDWHYTPGYAELTVNSPKRAAARVARTLFFKHWPDAVVRTIGGYALMVLAKPTSQAPSPS